MKTELCLLTVWILCFSSMNGQSWRLYSSYSDLVQLPDQILSITEPDWVQSTETVLVEGVEAVQFANIEVTGELPEILLGNKTVRAIRFINCNFSDMQGLINNLSCIKNLEVLAITACRATHWDGVIDISSGFERLVYLEVSGCGIKQFSISKELSSLKFLILIVNEIHDFSLLCSYLPNLTELDLGENLMKKLTLDTCKAIQLKGLFISRNRIRDDSIVWDSLPDSIETLDLSHNLIANLDPVIFRYQKLKTIGLNNNQIKHFPDAEAVQTELSRLDTLQLWGNPLSRKSKRLLATLKKAGAKIIYTLE